MQGDFIEDVPVKWTAKQIVALLREERHAKDWLFFEELRVGTGYAVDAEQRIDAYSIHPFPSRGLARVAYEVKISRSDFLAEIKKPQKRRRAMLLSNLFYFVAPAGLIRIEELPVDCGLIEVTGKGYLNTVVKAPHRDIASPPWLFVAALVRRAGLDGYAAGRDEAQKQIQDHTQRLNERIKELEGELDETAERLAEVTGVYT